LELWAAFLSLDPRPPKVSASVYETKADYDTDKVNSLAGKPLQRHLNL
jgi:hypothetical protein